MGTEKDPKHGFPTFFGGGILCRPVTGWLAARLDKCQTRRHVLARGKPARGRVFSFGSLPQQREVGVQTIEGTDERGPGTPTPTSTFSTFLLPLPPPSGPRRSDPTWSRWVSRLRRLVQVPSVLAAGPSWTWSAAQRVGFISHPLLGRLTGGRTQGWSRLVAGEPGQGLRERSELGMLGSFWGVFYLYPMRCTSKKPFTLLAKVPINFCRINPIFVSLLREDIVLLHFGMTIMIIMILFIVGREWEMVLF